MKMDLQSRMKNKAFWVALVSAIVVLTQQLGLNIFPENIMDITNTILLICTILGVFIDPTTPGFKDTKIYTKETNINVPKM